MPARNSRDEDTFLARRLKAVADPERVRLMRLLPATPKCELVYNVSELSSELGLSQSTVSHHLGILLSAGLVRREKMCRSVYYCVDAVGVRQIRDAIGDLLKVGG